MNPVVFLNHDSLLQFVNGEYKKVREDLMHVIEVEMAMFLLQKFLKLGVKAQDITIVCVYNKTVDVIKNYLGKYSLTQERYVNQSCQRE